ncbi:hypothetical protein M2447_002783 [Ereboglobus sp. PH5-10]|uniref:hypothetical protein n=1 Tax=Ereboglobus sp. PH5-10 TaxID=2940629 RepID=UPI002405E6BD|nr:hypothetical protein [Ereboglobus sp. PH5-10]MDF9828655.1 hypothetical protein [Ereboglobus sp. PH5-10]
MDPTSKKLKKMEELVQILLAKKNKELKALPAYYGFPNMEKFKEALDIAEQSQPEATTHGAILEAKLPRKRSPYTKTTPEQEKTIIEKAKEGLNDTEIAKSLGIKPRKVTSVRMKHGIKGRPGRSKSNSEQTPPATETMPLNARESRASLR